MVLVVGFIKPQLVFLFIINFSKISNKMFLLQLFWFLMVGWKTDSAMDMIDTFSL